MRTKYDDERQALVALLKGISTLLTNFLEDLSCDTVEKCGETGCSICAPEENDDDLDYIKEDAENKLLSEEDIANGHY